MVGPHEAKKDLLEAAAFFREEFAKLLDEGPVWYREHL